MSSLNSSVQTLLKRVNEIGKSVLDNKRSQDSTTLDQNTRIQSLRLDVNLLSLLQQIAGKLTFRSQIPTQTLRSTAPLYSLPISFDIYPNKFESESHLYNRDVQTPDGPYEDDRKLLEASPASFRSRYVYAYDPVDNQQTRITWIKPQWSIQNLNELKSIINVSSSALTNTPLYLGYAITIKFILDGALPSDQLASLIKLRISKFNASTNLTVINATVKEDAFYPISPNKKVMIFNTVVTAETAKTINWDHGISIYSTSEAPININEGSVEITPIFLSR